MAKVEEGKPPGKDYSRNRQKWITFLIGAGAVAVLLIIVFFFIIGVSSVRGDSMNPTLVDGQKVVFFRREPGYDRGELVTIYMPSGEYYVKRVVAVEGDTVDIRDGKFYLNGEPQDEPYAIGKTEPQESTVDYPLTVDENKVFVLGDNREHSTDSRTIGQVYIKSIKGKILGK